MSVSRPSMRLIIALGLTTRLTSREIVASGLGYDVNTLGKSRGKRYALLLRIANRGIVVIFGVGVDIVILGVDIAILGVDISILGVDIAILGVDIGILGVDITILGVDKAVLRRQKRNKKKWGGGGYGGREEGVVSGVRHLEAGWSVLESVDTRHSPFREFDQGGFWVVEESYDVTSGVIG